MSDQLLRVKSILDAIEIPFVLFASTLLGIYRDGEPCGAIYEFAVIDKDIDSKLPQLRIEVNHLNERPSSSGLGIINIPAINDERHDFEIHILHFKDDISYFNLVDDDCLVFPSNMWLKENWQKITWRDIEWNIPKDVEKYLEISYGDWKTPRGSNWREQTNRKDLKDL